MTLAAGFVVALAALTTGPQEASTPDVTVTARRLPKKPIRDAIGYFERHCYDASRMTGQPSMPRSDPDWRALSDAERATFGLAGKSDRAFGTQMDGGQSLVLTFSTARPTGDLIEQRCTLIVVGGAQDRFVDRVGAMFRGAGTQKHVGAVGGVPRRPGWRQLLWAAIPSIGSRDWRVFRTRESRDTWVQVIDPAFYRSAEYVVADLRTRVEGEPLTMLTLIHTRRPHRGDDAPVTSAASALPAR